MKYLNSGTFYCELEHDLNSVLVIPGLTYLKMQKCYINVMKSFFKNNSLRGTLRKCGYHIYGNIFVLRAECKD